MQETRIYDYMIRSGIVRCKWGGDENSFPVSIGMLPRKKENDLSANCVLSSEKGGLRVQVFMENDTGFPVEIQSLSLETTILLPENTQVFCNGYQSWSNSEMVEVTKGILSPPLYMPMLLKNSGDYRFATYGTGRAHSWTYTYFEAPIGFTLMASLDESLAYTRFQFKFDANKVGSSVYIEKDCEGFFLPPVPRTSGADIPPVKILDFFMKTGLEEDCFSQYFDLFYQLNSKNNLTNRSLPALAWDSWYALFNQVEENRILSILHEYKVREIPLDYFIIGQGYENQVGDWVVPSMNFPGGLPRVIRAIKATGYKPGITFSPFICSSKSQLFMERRELLAQDKNGRLIRVGKSRDQGGDLYLLDLYNPQAVNYIKRCIKTIIDEWGVQLFKFDFLYAAGLHSGVYVKRTRAQAMSHALCLLRLETGNIPVIACGTPIGSAIGLFEYCSVAPDLSPGWDGPNSFFVTNSVRERESTLSAIRSSIARRHLDGRAFSSDPGSFSLRKFKIKLTAKEQEALFKTCIIFGGLISNSDSVGSYSTDALDLYRLAITHKATRFHDKRVLLVEKSDKSYRVKYALRNELHEDTISLFGK